MDPGPCPVAEWLERRAERHIQMYAPVERVRNLSLSDAQEMPEFISDSR